MSAKFKIQPMSYCKRTVGDARYGFSTQKYINFNCIGLKCFHNNFFAGLYYLFVFAALFRNLQTNKNLLNIIYKIFFTFLPLIITAGCSNPFVIELLRIDVMTLINEMPIISQIIEKTRPSIVIGTLSP